MPRVNAAVKLLDGGVLHLLIGTESRWVSLIVSALVATIIGLELWPEGPPDWRLVILLSGVVTSYLFRFATWPRELSRIHTSLILAVLLGSLAVNLLKVAGSRHFFWYWNVTIAALLVAGVWRLIHPLASRKPRI